MSKRCLFSILSILLSASCVSGQPISTLDDFEQWCREIDPAHALSSTIGTELDPMERIRYGLLPGHDPFLRAELTPLSAGSYELRYWLDRDYYQYDGRYRLSAENLRLTRLHIWLCDQYAAQAESPTATESDRLRLAALRYASQNRYDLAVGILRDLKTSFPNTQSGQLAAGLIPLIQRLQSDNRVLIHNLSAGRGEGANDLRLFGGYYGLWLGFALPLSLGADSPEPYGAGLITGGPTGYFLASKYTETHAISEGNATMISLGGNFGAWQGMGWAGAVHADGQNVVGTGVACGLLGIGAAAMMTSRHDFGEGHAALTESAMSWGAWFGLVEAGISNSDFEDDVLYKTLIGSAGLTLATGIFAKDIVMTEKQVRFVNLGGILGSVMGMGLTMIIQPDDGSVAWGIIGGCGAAGLVMGLNSELKTGPTKQNNGPVNVSLTAPWFSTQPDLMNGGRAMPAVGVDIRF